MADISLIVDYTQVKQANKAILDVGTTAQKSASVFEKAFKKVEISQRKALSDVKQQMAVSKRMEAQKAKEINAAVKALNAQRLATEANTAQVHRYRMASDAVYAAEQKLLQLKKTLRTEITNGNMTMREAAAVQMQYKQSLNQVSAATQQTRSRQSQLGVLFQQTGYQVGDFAVQVQSGQNAMVAFGQQATQLVGTFGMLSQSTKMIAAFAGLGIAIPVLTAIGAALMRTRDAAKEAAESATELESNIKSLDKTLSDWVNTKKASAMGITVDELIGLGGIESAKKTVQDLKDKLNNLQETIYTNNLLGKFNKLVTGGYALEEAALEAIATAVDGVKDAEKRLADLRKKQDEDRLKSYNQQYDELKDQLKLEQAIASFGADSIRARNVEHQNEIDAMERSLNLAVESNEISGQHALSLFRVFEAIMRNKKASEEYASTMDTLQGQTEMFLSGIEESTEAARKKAEEHLDLVSRLEEQFGEATVTAFRLAGVSWADMEARLSNVADTAGRLASNLAVAASFGNGVGGEFADVPGGLDAFGGGGDYKYDLPSTYRPKTKTKGRSGGGGKSPAEELSEYLQKKQEEARLQERLLGLFGEERDIQSELISAKEKYNGVMTTAQANELEATLRQIAADKERQAALEESNAQMQSIADTMQSSMSDAFMSMVEGTKSFKDSMKDMARAVIKQLFDILVVQKLVGSFDKSTGAKSGIVGSIMGAFGFANGGAFSGGSQIQAFANGGVVGGPTMFPMTGGKTGLMGEAGPEAIMPLKRGANGKLGVEASGGGGGTTISQNFYFTANGDESVKRIIQQEAPRIANLTQKQIMDQRRRGGNMKATFG